MSSLVDSPSPVDYGIYSHEPSDNDETKISFEIFAAIATTGAETKPTGSTNATQAKELFVNTQAVYQCLTQNQQPDGVHIDDLHAKLGSMTIEYINEVLLQIMSFGLVWFGSDDERWCCDH